MALFKTTIRILVKLHVKEHVIMLYNKTNLLEIVILYYTQN